MADETLQGQKVSGSEVTKKRGLALPGRCWPWLSDDPALARLLEPAGWAAPPLRLRLGVGHPPRRDYPSNRASP